LGFVTEKRVLLAIALAGFLLTFLSLRRDGTPLVTGHTAWCVPAVVGLAASAYYLAARAQDPAYLTPLYCALFIGVTTLLGSLYFCAKPIVFASVFAAALLLNNFLVNPISEGLPILLRSSAVQHIKAIRKADPEAAWAAFDRAGSAHVAIAAGARVLNGVKTVPDLDLFGRLDPSGASRDVYNRYAFIAFALPRGNSTAPEFKVASGDFYWAFLSPLEPALRQAGLKYVIFPRQLSASESGPMKLRAALPENLLWIYQLPDAVTPALAAK
jgi:hypothetical protein